MPRSPTKARGRSRTPSTSIEQNGQTIYEYPKTPLPRIGAADRASFYQLKTMLQGVVARGTARAIGALSPYVAGKTGTTEDAVDGWFVGFTNDVTVAVWVGYDNGDGKRRSLGSNETGARVALPIFQPIIEAIWAEHIAPKAPLAGPSPEAQARARRPADRLHERRSRRRQTNNGGNVRWLSAARKTTDSGKLHRAFPPRPDGQVADTQYQLVSREDAYESSNRASGRQQRSRLFGGFASGGYRQQWPMDRAVLLSRIRVGRQPRNSRRSSRRRVGLFQPWQLEPATPPPQRNPNYFWGRTTDQFAESIQFDERI